MSRSLAVWCVVTVLGIGLAWAVYRSMQGEAAQPSSIAVAGSPRRDGAVAPSQPSELAALRRELVELRRQVSAQGQRLASGDEPPGPKDPRIDPETREEYARVRREALDAVDAAFRNEAMDRRWSSAASSAIQAAIATDDRLRSLASDIECRSQTCRLEIADNGAVDLDKWLPELTLRVGRELAGAVYDRIQGADGVSRRVLYLSEPHTSRATPR